MLLQAWAHEEGTQRLPVRQQAYMSAALEAAIARLGKEGLEGTPGLFAALLTGVSTRLNSPRPPIRSKEDLKTRRCRSQFFDLPSRPSPVPWQQLQQWQQVLLSKLSRIAGLFSGIECWRQGMQKLHSDTQCAFFMKYHLVWLPVCCYLHLDHMQKQKILRSGCDKCTYVCAGGRA